MSQAKVCTGRSRAIRDSAPVLVASAINTAVRRLCARAASRGDAFSWTRVTAAAALLAGWSAACLPSTGAARRAPPRPRPDFPLPSPSRSHWLPLSANDNDHRISSAMSSTATTSKAAMTGRLSDGGRDHDDAWHKIEMVINHFVLQRITIRTSTPRFNTVAINFTPTAVDELFVIKADAPGADRRVTTLGPRLNAAVIELFKKAIRPMVNTVFINFFKKAIPVGRDDLDPPNIPPPHAAQERR
ncbi:hypothetical protein AURDEDRAFT_162329 [Auricularia subglabra TFB-10046 SS5]|nr:hypothetical protein AURDEDRAFT_162329 [Auricularia subglabra TFB-10046 SS5]